MALHNRMPMLKQQTIFIIFVFSLILILVSMLCSCTPEQEAQPQKEKSLADDDYDGVANPVDLCQKTTEKHAVGKTGCSAFQLREQALLDLSQISIASFKEEDVTLLKDAQQALQESLDPSLYDESALPNCQQHSSIIQLQRKIVTALEKLSCIVDDASLVNATELNGYYTAQFKKKKSEKVSLGSGATERQIEEKMFELVNASCPKVAQELAGKALEEVLSAHFVMANDAYEKSQCPDTKEGALRNLKLSIENHQENR